MFKREFKKYLQIELKYFTFLLILIFITSTLLFPTYESQHSNEMGMPDYARGIVVDQHYIIIEQDTSHSLVVEEQITFRNTADTNHTEHIFAWSQPGDILHEINRFEFEIAGTHKFMNPQPAGNFLKTNLSAYNVTIKPQETFKLFFIYSLVYSASDDFYFGTTFLYNTSEIFIIITPQNNFLAEGDENVNLIYNSEAKKYATEHTDKLSMELGEPLTITFSKKVESTNGDNGDDNSGEDSNFSLYLIFIIIIILIILSIIIRFYFQKKSLAIEKEEQKKIQKEKRKTEQMKVSERSLKGSPSAKKSKKQELEGEGAQKLKSSSKKTSSRKDLIAEKKKILKAQDRIKKDYKEGLITKEMFDNLKNDYKQKLKVVNKKLEKMDKRTGDDLDQDYEDKEHSPELSKLIARKEKILKAINKLEDDRESGVLDEELYKEMVGTYKKQAIEILEMIDEIKGNK